MCYYDEELRKQAGRCYRTMKLVTVPGILFLVLIGTILGVVSDSILPSLFLIILGMVVMGLILRRVYTPKCPQCGKDLTNEYLVRKWYGFEINSLHYCPYCGKDFHQSIDRDEA